MEKKDIMSFSLQELYKTAKVLRASFHEGCLVSTYHNINKSDTIHSGIPLFQYPCRVDAVMVVICEKGQAKFTSNLRQYTLRENMLYINASNTIVKVDEIEDSVIHLIAFDETFLRDVHIDLKSILPQFIHLLDNPCMTILPEELDDIRQIFATIEREMENLSGKVYQKEILRGYTSFYASLLHITPKYLTTIIKQVSGRSAAEWIDECVILEAKNLLKYSSMSIQQIAYYLNFPNQSFFGTYFKRRTGMSPTEYKQS